MQRMTIKSLRWIFLGYSRFSNRILFLSYIWDAKVLCYDAIHKIGTLLITYNIDI